MIANTPISIQKLSPDRLKALLNYDQASGVFTWRVEHNRHYPGEVAGGLHLASKCIMIGIDNVRYRAHHLAWLYVTGKPPGTELDHRDTNRANNAWLNLRLASPSQNKFNTGFRKDNTSGVKGVVRSRRGGWEARIKLGGRRSHLGTFKTIEEAASAYAIASAQLHGEFGRVCTKDAPE